jgi:hypothetical protein
MCAPPKRAERKPKVEAPPLELPPSTAPSRAAGPLSPQRSAKKPNNAQKVSGGATRA